MWNAWFSGDPAKLREVYEATNGLGGPAGAGRDDGGFGLLNRVFRFFWAAPTPKGQQSDTKLHIPLAGDIASTSADLLFGEQLSIHVPDPTVNRVTQERLETIIGDGLYPTLLEGAETCSALGGAYLRITWDPAVADHVLWDAIPPDCAAPEFRSGRLVAVTFWRDLAREDGRVWRHLERHEPGRVYHGLYYGTSDQLGMVRALQDRPETEPFAALVDDQSGITTGARGLAAEYVPNMRPNRLMRGSPLGRSDYAGIEPVMDALDEVWTSLMRDVRLGKGRLVIPQEYLNSLGPGKAAFFDLDQELFTPLGQVIPENDGFTMEQVQFQIRVAEHLESARALAAQALRGAGYSVQSFGEAQDAAAVTATEVKTRERRSYTTRDRKIGYWDPVLRRLLTTSLEIDVAQFRPEGVTPMVPEIEWPDGVAIDPENQARTIQLLDQARAVSTRTKVTMLHPQWDEEQVTEEVDLIDGEADGGWSALAGAAAQASSQPVEEPEDVDDAPAAVV
ncbi:phage portal protein [Allonocardiopsis opalescens]|uniref:A118 family predicted phage portal protein n=1 Tax=Allonocardiopsis opalescens TaxID=1144618 RepID=A0A2T0PTC8_9ACTN|nr:phage portal protein [Allonocardiopsis opalescens]PRX91976.1 A118 family predicted phage portal protein [Allonocardiopsis opalescens]